VDTLTVAVLVVTLLVLVAPIIEIAVKRPGIFLEMITDVRAFAEAPLRAGLSAGIGVALRRRCVGRRRSMDGAGAAAVHCEITRM
jgi:hypothetical protein